MRKFFTLFAIAVTTIMAVSCEEDIPQNEPSAHYVEIAVIAEASDDDSRVALNGNTTSWEVGDKITLGLTVSYSIIRFAEMEIRSASDITANGKRAIFRGEVPAGDYYGVTALYPAVENASKDITLDREAVDNIFMSSSISNNYNPVLSVVAGTPVEIPLTFSHLMHKMDFNLSLASGYTSDDLNSNNIIVEVSATSNYSPLELATKQIINMRSNGLSTAESAASIRAYGNSPKFSTMLFPIGTTTKVALKFDVYIDGEKRYSINKPEDGTTLSIFRMTAGKTTTVNLVLSEENSTTGGGEIVAEAITLSATKNTIKANGTESTTLSVTTTDGGEDVTAQSTIYVNGGKLNGTTFTTTSAGTYTFYAERYGVRSNEVTITAEEVTNTGRTIIFAEGVTLTSGWYDVNKKAQGNNGDINMCWAATSSNMIEWWQDRYVAAGNTLPSTAVKGPGTKSYGEYGPYELALMEVYHSEWNNSLGGHPEEAIPWYFEGKLYGGEYASTSTQATPKTSGGYWSDVWSSIEPYIYRGYTHDLFSQQYPNMYTYCYNNYYIWGNGSELTGTDRLEKFTELVVQSFERGIAGLTISLSENLSSLHHAVTLWGYEIDNATGLLTRVWLTDSDDLEREPKTQLLNEYSVSVGSGKSHIKLSGNTRYGSAWVVSLHPFSGYGSANK